MTNHVIFQEKAAKMTPIEYTAVCLNITRAAQQRFPLALRNRLIHDPSATPDKPGRKALKFCIWGSPEGDFWSRDYSSYSIVYDPHKELAQDAPFQVRFMFFLNRKETGKGRFNQAVKNILIPLHDRRGFELEIIAKPEMIFLYRLYHNPALNPEWQKTATEDLTWLITQTFHRLDKLPTV